MNVGLLIIATGKYKNFLKNLIESADKYFLISHNVKYFLFVDEKVNLNSNREIEQLLIEHKAWPLSTLFRYQHFVKFSDKLKDLDYIYYIDSDMIFENEVSDEIFDDIVCTMHPWFVENRGTPENDKKSLAYIPNTFNFQYTIGAFFGGMKDCVLNMFHFISNQINIDFSRGIIAKWHDESHSNKFFILYATKILSPEYCYNKQSPDCVNNTHWIPKIVHVWKDENEMRMVDS